MSRNEVEQKRWVKEGLMSMAYTHPFLKGIVTEALKYMDELEKERKTCMFIRQNDEWVVYECSNCKEDWVYEDGTPEDNCYNYCPKCGAKIVEVKELEEDER